MCDIGTPGEKWGDAEKAMWLAQVNNVQRSYDEEVVVKLEPLKALFDVEQYGVLSYDERYKLFIVTSKGYSNDKKTVLVTGGCHGYETSGVQGALRFLETDAIKYADTFNVIVAPCLSPWGYETINRWTPKAVDPNRTFTDGSSEESAALLKYLADRKAADAAFIVEVHIDLHETTDSDATTFRPALFARDGRPANEVSKFIPDGFYLVANATSPQDAFQKAIIDKVRTVTHIAPTNDKGCLVGDSPITQEGVINFPARSIGLCMGAANAPFATTTEMYPSTKASDEECILAQVAAITGGLDYVKSILA